VTIIAHPEPTRTEPAHVLPSVDAIFETIALAQVEHLPLETTLLAALIGARTGMPPAEAINLACYAPLDDRFRAARVERERLLEQAGRAWRAAEHGETPGAVTL
jgi:hypothetical protein